MKGKTTQAYLLEITGANCFIFPIHFIPCRISDLWAVAYNKICIKLTGHRELLKEKMTDHGATKTCLPIYTLRGKKF